MSTNDPTARPRCGRDACLACERDELAAEVKRLRASHARCEALVERMRPKRTYCSLDGESFCRDRNLPDEHCCSSCKRARWADELASALASSERPGGE